MAHPNPGQGLEFGPCSFADGLNEAPLGDAYRYWQSKRRGRSMPCRSDIDPTEIPRLLPSLVITEMLDEGTRYRYRLAGSLVTAAFGRSLTGRCVDEVMAGTHRDFISSLYREVYVTRRCLFAQSGCRVGAECGLTIRRLLMPLSKDDRIVDKVLVLQTFHDALPNRPVAVTDVGEALAAGSRVFLDPSSPG